MRVQIRETSHGSQSRVNTENGAEEAEMDLQDKLLIETGCKELNDAVLECFFDKKDWRACQSEVTAFKQCYMEYQERRKIQEEESN